MNIRSDWIKKDNDDALSCKARFHESATTLIPLAISGLIKDFL